MTQRGMFERFTHNARTVVVFAQDIARIRGQAAVDTEHLLGGLIHGTANAAAAVLARLGIDPTDLHRRVDKALARGSGAPGGNIPFTEPAKQALLFSLREALQLRHDHIGTEHLLLGLIRQDHGAAAAILNRAGVRLGPARAQIERMPGRPVQAPPADCPHSSLGGVLVLYRQDDLAPSSVEYLNSTFEGHGELVLYSDSAELDPGQPGSALTAAIDECDVVLALIGPQWLTAADGNGRRIMHATDPVRSALEAATRLGRPTVTALLGNVQMPRAAELPPSLATLLDGDPIRIVPDTLHEHIAGLMRLYAPPN